MYIYREIYKRCSKGLWGRNSIKAQGEDITKDLSIKRKLIKKFGIMNVYINDSHKYDYMHVLVLILVFHQCQRGRLLIPNGYIIILSMISNLLTIGEMISHTVFDRWEPCLLINTIICNDWWRRFEKEITIDLVKRLSYML